MGQPRFTAAKQISRVGGGVGRPPADMGSVTRKLETARCLLRCNGGGGCFSFLPRMGDLKGVDKNDEKDGDGIETH